jgi:hypothetical protein
MTITDFVFAQAGLLPEQKALLAETVEGERGAMKDLLGLMDRFLAIWTAPTTENDVAASMIKQWAERWQRVFRRKLNVEDAWYLEAERLDALKVESEAAADANTEDVKAVDDQMLIE